MIHTLISLDKVKSACKGIITTRPTFKVFWTCQGPGLKMGSQWAHVTRLCTPNGIG